MRAISKVRTGFRGVAGFLGSTAAILACSAPVRADFVDVSSGFMTLVETSFGVSWADVDGDGDPDAFVTMYSTSQPNRLYRNDGGGSFPEVSPPILDALSSSIAGAAWGDYDADGDLDVYLNASGSNVCYLLRNEGSGWVNRATGTLSTGDDGRGATWVDFDGDGDLDLHRVGTGTCRMYRNDGTAFVETTPAPLGTPAQCASWGDYNADGFPDMVSVRDGAAAVLARNNGNGTFTNVATGALAAVAQATSANWVDYDNDGDLDLFIADYTALGRLFRNDGGDTFTSVPAGVITADTNLHAVFATWADFDNDGDLDVWTGGLSATPGARLCRNDGGTFVDDAPFPGIQTGAYYAGAAPADFDGDGDVDLMVGGTNYADHLYRNDLVSSFHWLEIDLVGWVSPTNGVGSRVEVVAGGRTQLRYVSAGCDGWASQAGSTIHVGLGAASAVNSLVVKWPSGRTSTLTNLAVDRRITVYEPGGLEPPASFAPGVAFDFRVGLNDAPVTAINLRHRPAGSGVAFASDAMVLSGTFFERSLSSSSASEHGIEYFLEFRRGGGSGERFPREGAAAPGFLPASLNSRNWPATPATGKYALFGVPFVPANGAVTAVLDELGSYDAKKWRFGRWDPGTGSGSYREFPGTETFAPGRAFWLVQKSPVTIATSGLSTSTVGGTALLLRPGWNQISDPYLFAVPLSSLDFTDAPNVEARLVRYDGSGYADTGTLAPWDGVWIRNNAAIPQTIVVPGVVAGAAAAPPAVTPASDGWRLRLSVAQGTTSDAGKVIGEATEATDEVDGMDFHAPPSLPGTPRVYLETMDAATVPHDLDVDLRAPSGRGSSWDVVVEAPGAETARLSIAGLAELPPDREAVLLTEDTFAAIDLRERPTLDLPGGRTYRFRLLVGDAAFVAAGQRGEDRVPAELALGLAYPNPFDGETRIGFALPRESRVSLQVYDVQGRRVRSLADDVRGAGRHVVTWDGRDEAGRRVGAGVYWARLVAGDQQRSQRMVRLD